MHFIILTTEGFWLTEIYKYKCKHKRQLTTILWGYLIININYNVIKHAMQPIFKDAKFIDTKRGDNMGYFSSDYPHTCRYSIFNYMHSFKL